MKAAVLLVAALAAGVCDSALADPKFWDADGGRWYEYISEQVTFEQALAAASARSYQGYQGYLATLLSWEEERIGNVIPQASWAWVGARTATGWRVHDVDWFTGPEGVQPGSPILGHWLTNPPCSPTLIGPNGEQLPCISGSGYLLINGAEVWDISGGTIDSTRTAGYLVEYGPAAPIAQVPEADVASMLAAGLLTLITIVSRRARQE